MCGMCPDTSVKVRQDQPVVRLIQFKEPVVFTESSHKLRSRSAACLFEGPPPVELQEIPSLSRDRSPRSRPVDPSCLWLSLGLLALAVQGEDWERAVMCTVTQ